MKTKTELEGEEVFFYAKGFDIGYNKAKQELIKAMEEVYKEKREHRKHCVYWENGKPCMKCGFGISDFIKDVKERLGEV